MMFLNQKSLEYIEFPEEFQKYLSPIDFCLDKMQGGKNLLMGDLIPSIYAIDHKLNLLLFDKALKYCVDLCKFLRECLKKRFNYLFDFEENITKAKHYM